MSFIATDESYLLFCLHRFTHFLTGVIAVAPMYAKPTIVSKIYRLGEV